MKEVTRLVLIRCDGSHRLGMGHVVRCLAVARELADLGQRVHFAVREGAPARRLIQDAGFPLAPGPEPGSDYLQWVGRLLAEEPEVLLLDVRDDFPVEGLLEARRRGVLLVTLDDPQPKRRLADLAFYPPLAASQELDWSGFQGTLFQGPEWVVLRPSFAGEANWTWQNPPRILVSMGGSDPLQLTRLACQALEQVSLPLQVDLLVGPAFQEQDWQGSGRGHRYRLHRALPDPAPLMKKAQLGLVAFGMTAWELAALGIPALYLCLSREHAQAASVLVNRGVGLVAGLAREVSPESLAGQVQDLLEHPERLQEMSRRAGGWIDAGGARRIAQIICSRLRKEVSHAR